MLRPFRAVLADLDGTLVDSHAPTEAAWRAWARASGLAGEADEIARSCHGVPSVQHVARWAPALDAAAESARIEAAQVASDEPTPGHPGALELLRCMPPERLAIVTSGTPELAHGRLARAGLPRPRVMVCAGDVARGKPAPDPYLRGAELLGVAAADCLVLEDAPAGIASGKAAGCQVLAVGHTHADGELAQADVRAASLAEALPALRAALAADR